VHAVRLPDAADRDGRLVHVQSTIETPTC
jgi:hypothetical protein